MNIPGTIYQLAVLLVLVMPGVVYAAFRSRWRGSSYEDRDVGARVLRAMAVSAALDSIYAIALGPHFYSLAHSESGKGRAGAPLAAHSRELGVWAIFLIFLVPAALAFVTHGLRWGLSGQRPWRLSLDRRRPYDPTPTAWEWATERMGGCFVRIRRNDGHYVGGWVDERGYAATYPHPRDLFIGRPYRIADDGVFIGPIANAVGMYLSLNDGEVVDWVLTPKQAEEAGRTPMYQ
jgi:hypothetical protein